MTRRVTRPGAPVVDDITRAAQTYLFNRGQKADSDRHMKGVYAKLTEHIDKNGSTDNRGSLYWYFAKALTIGGKKFYGLKRQIADPQIVVDTEAADKLLREKKLTTAVQYWVFAMDTEARLDEKQAVGLLRAAEELGVTGSSAYVARDYDELYVLNQRKKITDEELDHCLVETWPQNTKDTSKPNYSLVVLTEPAPGEE